MSIKTLDFVQNINKNKNFEIFGNKAIRHMWRVANGLDSADLEDVTDVPMIHGPKRRKGHSIKDIRV